MEGRKLLLWAPRLVLIVFALFLVIFSFDVFGEGKSATNVALGFILHNIPSIILGLLVFAAWRREWIGASACLVLGVAYIVWAWERFPLSVYFAITGPLFLVAALYAINWWRRSHHGQPH